MLASASDGIRRPRRMRGVVDVARVVSITPVNAFARQPEARASLLRESHTGKQALHGRFKSRAQLGM
jgi:hypothetical protein